MYDRIYTYDVTDYFFTNTNNTILAEAVSLAFDGSHAYFSCRIVIESAPLPEPPRPTTAAPVKRKTAATPKAKAPAVTKPAAATAAKENTVFEAGRDPEINKLRVRQHP